MATKRRFARHAGKKKKSVPPWLFALGGVIVGVGIAWGVYQFYPKKAPAQKPTQAAAPAATPAPPQKRVAAPTPEKKPVAAKPKYDFYTLLSRNETVLPDRVSRQAPAAPRPDASAHYVLQAGSFGEFADADRLKAKLALSGLEAHIEKIVIEGKGDFYRVRLGPYRQIADLDSYHKRLTDLGVKALRIQVKPGQ